VRTFKISKSLSKRSYNLPPRANTTLLSINRNLLPFTPLTTIRPHLRTSPPLLFPVPHTIWTKGKRNTSFNPFAIKQTNLGLLKSARETSTLTHGGRAFPRVHLTPSLCSLPRVNPCNKTSNLFPVGVNACLSSRRPRPIISRPCPRSHQPQPPSPTSTPTRHQTSLLAPSLKPILFTTTNLPWNSTSTRTSASHRCFPVRRWVRGRMHHILSCARRLRLPLRCSHTRALIHHNRSSRQDRSGAGEKWLLGCLCGCTSDQLRCRIHCISPYHISFLPLSHHALI